MRVIVNLRLRSVGAGRADASAAGHVSAKAAASSGRSPESGLYDKQMILTGGLPGIGIETGRAFASAGAVFTPAVHALISCGVTPGGRASGLGGY